MTLQYNKRPFLGLFYLGYMEFSVKIKQRSESPLFLTSDKSALNHSCDVLLSKLDINLTAYFNTVKTDELEVEMINYFTDYKGPYLGVIDAFFQLIQNRPIEAIDRFPIKELDYFLRDTQGESAFSGYSQEIYEILSIGESIKTKIYGDKKLGFQFDPKIEGEFFNLSTSEQFELLEELFAYYVYDKGKIDSIEVCEIDEKEIVLSFITDELKVLIIEKLCLPLDTRISV